MEATKKLAELLDRQKAVWAARSRLKIQIGRLQQQDTSLASEEEELFHLVQGIEMGRNIQREYDQAQAAKVLTDDQKAN